jgi:hypothetical protein
VDLASAMQSTIAHGYAFIHSAIGESLCGQLDAELDSLPLAPTDNIAKPLNTGTSFEVLQKHECLYLPIPSPQTPVANIVSEGLVRAVHDLSAVHPSLAHWRINEVGYQRYRDDTDGISPHRDRRDLLLKATITLSGQAIVKILESLGAAQDYSRLRVIDSCIASRGTIMLLRASGYGLGYPVIHQVEPPTNGDRAILNLSMQP